jgi:hypothetical protein
MSETLGERLFRVATLDRDVFDDVGADAGQTGPALTIVFGVALATGLGRLPAEGLRGLLLGALETCLHFGLWLAVLQAALVALGRPDRFAPLFRALGFAAAPFGLAIFAPLPLLGPLAGVVGLLLGLGCAWRAVARAGELALPEAGVICFAALFAALWISSVILSTVVH